MNLGARDATTDWVLLANPDVVFTRGSIDELLRVGMADDSIGVVGPLILTSEGDVYPSARRLPSLRTGIGHALFGTIWKSNPWTKSYLSDRELPPRQREAGWVSGACMLVRRSVFDAVGGFDDKYFMYFEDVDLCARVAKSGAKVLYAPSASIVHAGAHSTSASSKLMITVHHESAYKYLAAKYRSWYLAPLRAVLRIGLRARAAIFVRK
jgi:N-acetylglucosaminyl-diphospho-decaprenol L-rhamnosyltransferase